MYIYERVADLDGDLDFDGVIEAYSLLPVLERRFRNHYVDALSGTSCLIHIC